MIENVMFCPTDVIIDFLKESSKNMANCIPRAFPLVGQSTYFYK
jgi:hypothetical protein